MHEEAYLNLLSITRVQAKKLQANQLSCKSIAL